MNSATTAVTADPHVLKANVQRIARELGFDACRIAAAAPARHAREFRDWVEGERFGDMTWLARDPDRRADPRIVLPGAKSVIIAAMNYLPEAEPQPARRDGAARGRIARYAVGDDYHDVMEGRLEDIARHLEEAGGINRIYVDTGPVLERDFASEAGLGWNGKSTVQIDRSLGTWFFLGEILTTLELPPDAPETDRCGSCTRCIDVCPTDAITSPRRLDARRCISYLTIEHKGAIPEEFRRAIGNRVYGCDDCLEVCPWNRFAAASRAAAFQARSHVAEFRLRDYLSLTDTEFRALFRRSPIKRTGRTRFLRNVCVALGNVGDTSDLPALRRAAAAEPSLIAEHAAWAIAEIEGRA